MLLGSILQWADAQTIAAGAGFLSADSRPIALPSSVFLLRGPLTAAVLERLGGYPVGSVPFGDPGVLASRLFPASDTGDIPFAVIPHYVDNQESALHEVSAEIRFNLFRDISSCFIGVVLFCQVPYMALFSPMRTASQHSGWNLATECSVMALNSLITIRALVCRRRMCPTFG
jgi:hypothetical protein